MRICPKAQAILAEKTKELKQENKNKEKGENKGKSKSNGSRYEKKSLRR
jgi:hypothetical protein